MGGVDSPAVAPTVARRWEQLGKLAVQRLVEEINEAIERRNLDAQVVYVDDVGGVGYGKDLDAVSAVIRDELNVVGLDFKSTKREASEGGRLVFVGIGADFDKLELFLDDAKRASVAMQLEELQRQRRQGDGAVALASVRSVVGLISFASASYSAGHTYVRRMWDAMARVPLEHQRRGSKHCFIPDDDFWLDVEWWQAALVLPGRRRIVPRMGTGRLGFWRGELGQADLVVATDASEVAWGYVVYPDGFFPVDVLCPQDVTAADAEMGALGTTSTGLYGFDLPAGRLFRAAGVDANGVSHATQLDRDYRDDAVRRVTGMRARVVKGERRRDRFDASLRGRSINYKELWTVLKMATDHAASWAGKRILLRIDNKTAMSYVNKGYGRSLVLTAVARDLKALQARWGFEVVAKYVNTKVNWLPDQLSRLRVAASTQDWMLVQSVFDTLTAAHGPFWADMMAATDGSNAQLPRYFSEQHSAYDVKIEGIGRGRVTNN
jgi:hypothetical protein